MTDDLRLVQRGLGRWVATDHLDPIDPLPAEEALSLLRAAVAHLPGTELVSATVNHLGEFQPPPLGWDPLPGMPQLPPFDWAAGLPPFWDIRLRQATDGGHIAETVLWAPLAWNGRLLGSLGGGSRTGPIWLERAFTRSITLQGAIRNGFAAVATDGGNQDRRWLDWPIRADATLDMELIRNWAHRSTHDMTVAAKAIVEALYGRAPRYSYLTGGSGGGRQAIASAQFHPRDYDGIWAADPAINWPAMIASGLWPALVMKELDNAVSAAKLEAFRAAAIARCDGLCDGVVGAYDACDYDPSLLIGHALDTGEVISAADAEVVRRIWQGPRRANGNFLWYGIRPCVRSWGYVGLASTVEEKDGLLVPSPSGLSTAHFRWIMKDVDFDWRDLTFDSFEQLFDEGVRDLAETATDDPDLSDFRDHGSKLIISQAADDEILPYQSVLDYYRRAQEAMGGETALSSFARLFVSDGDSHLGCVGEAAGMTMAGAMTALMRWVEHDEAPDRIVAERIDMQSGARLASRPVFPYPLATRYAGQGDPASASSYVSVRAEDTVLAALGGRR